MPKCSKYDAKSQILVPNCCKYKADGTRKESQQKFQNLSQKKIQKLFCTQWEISDFNMFPFPTVPHFVFNVLNVFDSISFRSGFRRTLISGDFELGRSGSNGSTQVCFGRGMWCWWILQILAKEVRCQSHRRRVNLTHVLWKHVKTCFGSCTELSISLVFPETSSCRCQNDFLWFSCLVGTWICCLGELFLSYIVASWAHVLFVPKLLKA